MNAMLPQIEIKCSWFLQRFILFNLHKFPQLYRFTLKFTKAIKPYLPRIVIEIQKSTGIKWEEKHIDVWMIDGFHPSICSPLLLNWYEGDVNLVIFSLIHELVHINLKDIFAKSNDRFDPILLEALVELISKRVFIKIFSSKKFESIKEKVKFGDIYSHVWEKELELEKWCNTDKRPLLEMIKREKEKFEIKKGWWKDTRFKYILNV